MTTILHRLALFLALCVPGALLAMDRQGSAPSNSRFVICIHAGGIPEDEKKPDGGAKMSDDSRVKEIAIPLVRKQYTVRVPDRDQDRVGGPGVDYFDDTAKAAAEDVANTVNATLKALKLL